jgi:hypothetical protein
MILLRYVGDISRDNVIIILQQCNGNHTETTEHHLLHCNKNAVSRTTLFPYIKHMLCPELIITLSRDISPTYRKTIIVSYSSWGKL